MSRNWSLDIGLSESSGRTSAQRAAVRAAGRFDDRRENTYTIAPGESETVEVFTLCDMLLVRRITPGGQLSVSLRLHEPQPGDARSTFPVVVDPLLVLTGVQLNSMALTNEGTRPLTCTVHVYGQSQNQIAAADPQLQAMYDAGIISAPTNAALDVYLASQGNNNHDGGHF